MAFCGKCGHQLQGNEHFCANCGRSIGADRASVEAAASAASVPAQQPVAVVNPPTAHGGRLALKTLLVTCAAGAAASMKIQMPLGRSVAGILLSICVVVYLYRRLHTWKSEGQGIKGAWIARTLMAVCVLAAIGFAVILIPRQVPSFTAATSPKASQTAEPVEPTSRGTSQSRGASKNLVKQQYLTIVWKAVNQNVMVGAQWTNYSTTAIDEAVMECDQYDANGNNLFEFQRKLGGPAATGIPNKYENVEMGALAPGAVKLDCGIISVVPTK